MERRQEPWKTATIVGNWFLGIGGDGRPEVGGRITRGLGRGRYLITYSFANDGVKVEPVLSADQIAYLKLLLFDNQKAWREAFAKASRN